MKKNQSNIVGFLILFFLTACYGTVGNNFDSLQIKSIQSNVTSQEEIFKRFGAPFKKGVVRNSHPIQSHQYGKIGARLHN